jgi:predicted ferric reductase
MGVNRPVIPEGVIPFGSNTNCNLDVCPVEWSLYGYRPSREANYTFVALFTLLGLLHVILGVRWKSWGFMVGMILGSLCEVIGYVGRIMLWTNPFHYKAFMIQIST